MVVVAAIDCGSNSTRLLISEVNNGKLKKLLKGLKSDSTLFIEIAGHTDDRGEEEENQKLSEARAQTVKNYLVKNGILESRLEAKGYGESQPVQSNDSKAGRQANRRTEVRILEKEL